MKIPYVGVPLVAAMVALSACSGTSASTTVQNEQTAGVAATEASTDLGLGAPSPEMCKGEKYTIGYDVFSDVQEFAAAMTKDMQAVADELGCVELVVLTDNADPATALSNVKTLIEQEVDGVVLFQVVASAQKGIMDALDAASIPAVAVAVPAPGAPFMSIEDAESGRIAGRNLADTLIAEDAADSAYLLLGEFPSGGQAVLDRAQGVLDGLREKIPNFSDDRVVRVDAGASADSGFTAGTSVLGKLPPDAPIATSAVNDDAVSGLVRALETSGRTDVYAAGMGVVAPSGAKYVCTSPLYVGGVAFYPENWGKYVIPAILAEVQGETLPPATYLPQNWMTKDEVAGTYPDACA